MSSIIYIPTKQYDLNSGYICTQFTHTTTHPCDQTASALTLMLFVNTVKRSLSWPWPPHRTAVTSLTPLTSLLQDDWCTEVPCDHYTHIRTLSLCLSHTFLHLTFHSGQAHFLMSAWPTELVHLQGWGGSAARGQGVAAPWAKFSGLDWLI